MAGPIPVPVHTAEKKDGQDSFTIDCTLRIAVLNAATGQPVTDAYVTKPAMTAKLQQILDRRGVHPFRVLDARSVTFINGTNFSDSLGVEDVYIWEVDSSSTEKQKKLKITPKSTGEFIHQAATPEVLAGGTDTFIKINGTGERYIKSRTGTKDHVLRDLITNTKGILEVPISFGDWLANTEVTIRFRDYLVVKAEGVLAPDNLIASERAAGKTPSENGHKALNVALTLEPSANNWKAGPASQQQTFQNELGFKPVEWGKEADATVWVVRRVQQATTLWPVVAGGTGTYVRRGIMVHYNSGYYMTEQRGTTNRLCREAFTSEENDYMMRPAMALLILQHVLPGNVLGYHYHIGREGAIYIAARENASAPHAGDSREPDSVTARENVDTNPRSTTHNIANPRGNWNTTLNSSYVGIDVLGTHEAARYHYTPHQLWYMDRLIENIRSRNPEIHWYNILGHDEARQAFIGEYGSPNGNPASQIMSGQMKYKCVHGTSTKWVAKKGDPGAAIDGMDLLRGRHGATF